MKMNKISLSISTALLAAGFMTSSAVNAQGRLVVYCSATNILCETTTKAFGEKYDVKTSFIRNGSGSTFAKVEAEKNNPQADVWFGGTFDPQAQAAELGLIEPYKSKHIDEIVERFRDPAKTKGHYVSAIYMGILGFGVNTERLAKLGIKEVPKCWKDLTDPRLKGEVQIADPQSAGTAYTALATFVQLWGEEKAFDFLKALHPNVSQYIDNAKLFVDWALSKEGQELAWKQGDSLQILTNTTAEQSPTAFDPNKLNLINYDFEKYGATEQRKALIEKWVQDVKLAK